MKVIVTRAYGYHEKGDVIPEMPFGQADTLIRRGLVRDYSDRQVKAAPVNRALRTPTTPTKRRAKHAS